MTKTSKSKTGLFRITIPHSIITVFNFRDVEAVQQSLSVRYLLLAFRFKALIHLPFLRILNYWTASICFNAKMEDS